MPTVRVTTPDGTTGTVASEELAMMPAGTKVIGTTPTSPEDPGAGLLGSAVAGILGAGSAATLGASDVLLKKGAYIAGGKPFEKEVTGELKRVREEHPYAETAGEFGGLLLNPEALAGAGELAGGAVAARAGEGLLGSVLSSTARTAAETALLGAQHQITEDALGDHEFNGEAVFANAAKEGLFGAAIGAPLGAIGYGGRKAVGLLKGAASKLALDELAGAKGAGEKLYENAEAREAAIAELRAKGMSREEAVAAVGDVTDTVKAASAVAPEEKGIFGKALDRYIDDVHPDQASTLRRHRAVEEGTLEEAVARKRNAAINMEREGTKAIRFIEDPANDIAFTQKATKIAPKVDIGKWDVQVDEARRLLDETDTMLEYWAKTPDNGGLGTLPALRKKVAAARERIVEAMESGEQKGGELFMELDGLKRAMDSYIPYGRAPGTLIEGHAAFHGLPRATNDILKYADRWRSNLEDATIWGEAGPLQARQNFAFADAKPRRDDLMRLIGNDVDVVQGVRQPKIDVSKTKSFLDRITGDREFDERMEEVVSARKWISGFRNRSAAALEGGVTEAEAAKLAEGNRAIDSFEKTLNDSIEEAAASNKLRDALGSEAHKPGFKGVLGAISDFTLKPHATVSRLVALDQTAKGVIKGVKKLLGAAVEGKGSGAAKAATRPRAAIIKEMGDARVAASNPAAMEAAVSNITGDLADVAPKTANEARLAAMRAIFYLAKEAPPASTTNTGAFGAPTPRYSDTQLRQWEAKRNAAMDPRAALEGLHDGHINREAIQAAEVVSPRIFALMQETARDEIARLEQAGKLDTVPYNRRAAIATLLKVPADRTFEPGFIASMQAAMTVPPEEPQGGGGGSGGGSSSGPAKPPTWMVTEAQSIEGGIA